MNETRHEFVERNKYELARRDARVRKRQKLRVRLDDL